MSTENPFASPLSTSLPPVAHSVDSFPKYSKVVLIIDLVLCMPRLLVVVLSIAGFMVMNRNNPLYHFSIPEIVTGLLIVVFGVLGDVLVLTKRRWALYLCWLGVVAALLNLIVGFCEVPVIWGAKVARGEIPPDQAEAVRIGMWAGAIFTGFIRLGLNVAYCTALVFAKRYFDRCSRV